ncbi:TetR/AcrR family transcriptional regulator [Agrobacterium pusense]|uniref:TetR/AcrR family transcriptional regulator n=1 Tax=Agrobacterium pusense TaxID=648995 RepID=UPI003D0D8DF6
MPKKMPKSDRRTQLLEIAHLIVREDGTDALTLATLAERAGVTKPVAYNHFGTRAGLMIALYKEIMDQQVRALAQALDDSPASLRDVAEVLAEAYMLCHETIGPEWHAIGGALRGDAQMDAVQREMIDGHIAFFAAALAPYSKLPPEAVRRRCLGIIGAGEALSDALVRKRVRKDEAIQDFLTLILCWIGA